MNPSKWFSRKGDDCNENRDFGVFARTDNKSLIAIVDASKKGGHGHLLAREICQNLINNISSIDPSESATIINFLKNLHQNIRYQYLHETACYAIGSFNNFGEGWIANCGDCRVGNIIDGEPIWINPVHTAANMTGDDFLIEHAKLNSRHTITRCWNSKRFQTPSITKITLDNKEICFATDGFWIDHKILGVSIDNSKDDLSYLTLHSNDTEIKINNENFLTNLNKSNSST